MKHLGDRGGKNYRVSNRCGARTMKPSFSQGSLFTQPARWGIKQGLNLAQGEKGRSALIGKTKSDKPTWPSSQGGWEGRHLGGCTTRIGAEGIMSPAKKKLGTRDKAVLGKKKFSLGHGKFRSIANMVEPYSWKATWFSDDLERTLKGKGKISVQTG